jgi:hypothetical protein
MRDLEKFAGVDYVRLELDSPGIRRRFPRSPSRPRTPIYQYRRKSPYIRVLILVVTMLLLFSSLDRVCSKSVVTQRVITYVSSVVESFHFCNNQSPFAQQSPLRPWDVVGGVDVEEEGLEELDSLSYEASMRRMEDDTGVRQMIHIINETVNDTAIFVPVRSRHMTWVNNLRCRLSFLNVSNVVYWAIDEKAATRLQEIGAKFYFNPLLEARTNATRTLDEAQNIIRLWSWVVDAGTNLLYLEPTVTLFDNPIQALEMDADIEAIIDSKSLDGASVSAETLPRFGTGVIWLKSTDSTKAFLAELTSELNSGKHSDETDVLNSVLREHPERYTLVDSTATSPVETTSDTPTPDSTLSYRYVSPTQFVNYPIFECDMHLHTSGYSSAFSLRDSNWDDDRFYPTLLYIHPREMEQYDIQKRDGEDHPRDSRMIQRWRSLEWWELVADGRCALLASKPMNEPT